MKISDLKEGMKLKVRTWKSMEKEFGLDGAGDITCQCCFVKGMKPAIGTVVTVNKGGGGHHLVGNWYVSGDLPRGYCWSIDMFEPVKAKKPAPFKLPKKLTRGDVIVLADGQRKTIYTTKPDFEGEIIVEGYDPGFLKADGSVPDRYLPEGELWYVVAYEPKAKPKPKAKKPAHFKLPKKLHAGDVVVLADGQRKMIMDGTAYNNEICVNGLVPGYISPDGSALKRYGTEGAKWYVVAYEPKPKATPKPNPKPKPKYIVLPADIAIGDVIVLADGQRKTVNHRMTPNIVSVTGCFPGTVRMDGTRRDCDSDDDWRPVAVEKKAKPKYIKLPEDIAVGDTIVLADGQRRVVDNLGERVVSVDGCCPGFVRRDGGHSTDPGYRPVAVEKKVRKWYTRSQILGLVASTGPIPVLARHVGFNADTAQSVGFFVTSTRGVVNGVEYNIDASNFMRHEYSLDMGKTWVPFGV